MTTDQQVRLLMSLIKSGLSLPAAAAKAGMSERTARKYRHAGKLPSQLRAAHTWRTRPDPFEAVWPEIEALLEQDVGLEAGRRLGRRGGRLRAIDPEKLKAILSTLNTGARKAAVCHNFGVKRVTLYRLLARCGLEASAQQ